MRRKEALALIGKPVYCWTGLNGEYIGILEQVTDSRPFRAVVKTLAVVHYPIHGIGRSGSYTARRAFELNSRHKFGAVSIKVHEGEIPEWRESAIDAVKRAIKVTETNIQSGEKYPSRSYRQAEHLLKKAIVTLNEHLKYLEAHPNCTYVANRDQRITQH